MKNRIPIKFLDSRLCINTDQLHSVEIQGDFIEFFFNGYSRKYDWSEQPGRALEIYKEITGLTE